MNAVLKPHWNKGRSFKKAWAGTWGPLGDRRSRLSRLAQQIEREIATELGAEHLTPIMKRRVAAAASIGALAEHARATLGVDKGTTKRNVVVYARLFQHELARLRADVVASPIEERFAARVRGGHV